MQTEPKPDGLELLQDVIPGSGCFALFGDASDGEAGLGTVQLGKWTLDDPQYPGVPCCRVDSGASWPIPSLSGGTCYIVFEDGNQSRQGTIHEWGMVCREDSSS